MIFIAIIMIMFSSSLSTSSATKLSSFLLLALDPLVLIFSSKILKITLSSLTSRYLDNGGHCQLHYNYYY